MWVPIIFDAPDFVNVEFEELFPDGIPPITPFIAQRDLPWNFPAREEEPEPQARDAAANRGVTAGRDTARGIDGA